MGKRTAAIAVADGVHAVSSCGELIIDRDKAARVSGDSGSIKAEIVSIWSPPGGHQYM